MRYNKSSLRVEKLIALSAYIRKTQINNSLRHFGALDKRTTAERKSVRLDQKLANWKQANKKVYTKNQ